MKIQGKSLTLRHCLYTPFIAPDLDMQAICVIEFVFHAQFNQPLLLSPQTCRGGSLRHQVNLTGVDVESVYKVEYFLQVTFIVNNKFEVRLGCWRKKPY